MRIKPFSFSPSVAFNSNVRMKPSSTSMDRAKIKPSSFSLLVASNSNARIQSFSISMNKIRMKLSSSKSKDTIF